MCPDSVINQRENNSTAHLQNKPSKLEKDEVTAEH